MIATVLCAAALFAAPGTAAAFEPHFPSDPKFDQQWNLHNTGWPLGVPDADIDAPEAWGRIQGRTLAPVSVAVLEEGVNISNPEFAGQLWVNPDEVRNELDDDGNGYSDDIHGSYWQLRIGARDDNGYPDSHGSLVSGIIAAAHNDLEIAGVAPNARLMVLQGGPFGRTRGEHLGLEYALSKDARVVNLSLGRGDHTGIGDHDNFCPVIDRLTKNGTLVVAAAGNDGLDSDQVPFWPAACPGTISVAATNQYDVLRPYSNWGAKNVDIAAPAGVPSICTFYGGCSLGGTSAAAPMVSGVAVILFGLHPDAEVDDVRRAILESADPIGHLPDNQGKPTATNGRLNADRAIVRLDQIMAAKSTAPDTSTPPSPPLPSAPTTTGGGSVPRQAEAGPRPRLTRQRARAFVRAYRGGSAPARRALARGPLRIAIADVNADRRPEAIVSVPLGKRRLWLVISDASGRDRIVIRRTLTKGARLETRRGRLWVVTPRAGRAPSRIAVSLPR
ncbi:S8 family serine peptidase [Miltoncostaea oceani]|uniref:S8 family serine peptidase n=1 Tax=Miltoncostaea oceani TaxID=2843216 RepID=UPI001C3DF76A|nr:S8 family serine peptidase [Miltoncostaea oceani]